MKCRPGGISEREKPFLMKSFFIRLVALAAIVAAVQYFAGWGEVLGFLENLVRSNPSPEIFLVVMGLGCAAGMPLSFCYIFAGAAYPFWQAWPLCLCGLFISASLGYLAGAFLAPKDFVDRMSERFGLNLQSRGMMNLNFFVRVVPVMPYTAQNILLGAAGSKYGVYILVNMLVQAAISAAMLLLSGALFAEGSMDAKRLFVIAALVLVIALEHWILRRIYAKEKNSEPKK